MSHVMNDREALVAEAIDGMVRASGGRLDRLDGYPDIRVVLRRGRDPTKVAVVSGGGAGHEPAHAGFVGGGMLAAAVSGDVFASPSTEAVLAAIRAVAGPAGVLLVVKNYTGDRLNFGLAAERARARGIAVETVIVGDDVALPDNAQPRGIAGTLLVHKVAGDAAESGLALAEVAARARAAAEGVRSIGMALSTCSVPGQEAEERIGKGEAELGLGIHGEEGAERGPLPTARDAVASMLERLGVAGMDGPLALLVNDLGGLSALEMAVVTEAALAALGEKAGLLVGPAAMMTSLDMKGVSLSVLPLGEGVREALSAATDAPGWPGATVPGAVGLVPVPDGLDEEEDGEGGGAEVGPDGRAAVETVLDALTGLEDELNRLDARVGDGDTGTTVARAARSVRDGLDAAMRPDWGGTLAGIGRRAGRAMGGSSGVVASIFLAAAGRALRDGADWGEAIEAGLERVSFHGGAREGGRTAIDALAPAARELKGGGGIAAAADAAEQGAERTAEVTETGSGRSSYLGADTLRGVKDPGAVAVAAMLRALAGRAG